MKECGLYIEKRFGTYTQVGLNEFDNSYENMPELFKEYLKSRKYGELYQFVYVVSKILKRKNEDYIVEYADYQYVQIFWITRVRDMLSIANGIYILMKRQ